MFEEAIDGTTSEGLLSAGSRTRSQCDDEAPGRDDDMIRDCGGIRRVRMRCEVEDCGGFASRGRIFTDQIDVVQSQDATGMIAG